MVAMVKADELTRMTRTAMAMTSTVYLSVPPERFERHRWIYIP